MNRLDEKTAAGIDKQTLGTQPSQRCQRQLKSDPPLVCSGKLELTHQP